MKTVYSLNREIVGLWVTGRQHLARAGSTRTENGKLYSYETVIAEIVNGVACISTNSYSRTTQRHQTLARRCAGGAGLPVCCAFVVQGNRSPVRDVIESEYERRLEEANRRRPAVRARELQALQEFTETNNTYLMHIGLAPLPDAPEPTGAEVAALSKHDASVALRRAQKKEAARRASRAAQWRESEKIHRALADIDAYTEGLRAGLPRIHDVRFNDAVEAALAPFTPLVIVWAPYVREPIKATLVARGPLSSVISLQPIARAWARWRDTGAPQVDTDRVSSGFTINVDGSLQLHNYRQARVSAAELRRVCEYTLTHAPEEV